MSELILKAIFLLLAGVVILLLYQFKRHQIMRVKNEFNCCMSVFCTFHFGNIVYGEKYLLGDGANKCGFKKIQIHMGIMM
jgi:hypothetical protein